MDLEQKSIERIKLASEMSLRHYGLPLVCTYSGGKDSDVMLELFKRSGVPFEVHHSLTTADAPQTVYHVREVFRELKMHGIKCTVDKHEYIDQNGKKCRTTMWNLIPRKGMPPTRRKRYCCSVLKETGCAHRMISTGVRWDESKSREDREVYEALGATKKDRIDISEEMMLLSDNDDKRRLFEKCEIKAKTVVNPIIDWTNADIWEFVHAENIQTNCLYKDGFKRVGCIGCPMAGKERWFEFAIFPQIQDAYIRSFDRMLEVRKTKGKECRWKSGQDVFLWWMEDENVEGQMSFEDFPEVMP